MTNVSDANARAVLRCVPDAGSGEVVSVHEIKERLGLSTSTVTKVLLDAVRSGAVERPRTGAYRLAPKTRAPLPAVAVPPAAPTEQS